MRRPFTPLEVALAALPVLTLGGLVDFVQVWRLVAALVGSADPWVLARDNPQLLLAGPIHALALALLVHRGRAAGASRLGAAALLLALASQVLLIAIFLGRDYWFAAQLAGKTTTTPLAEAFAPREWLRYAKVVYAAEVVGHAIGLFLAVRRRASPFVGLALAAPSRVLVSLVPPYSSSVLGLAIALAVPAVGLPLALRGARLALERLGIAQDEGGPIPEIPESPSPS